MSRGGSVAREEGASREAPPLGAATCLKEGDEGAAFRRTDARRRDPLAAAAPRICSHGPRRCHEGEAMSRGGGVAREEGASREAPPHSAPRPVAKRETRVLRSDVPTLDAATRREEGVRRADARREIEGVPQRDDGTVMARP
jgi:hypothetical protein